MASRRIDPDIAAEEHEKVVLGAALDIFRRKDIEAAIGLCDAPITASAGQQTQRPSPEGRMISDVSRSVKAALLAYGRADDIAVQDVWRDMLHFTSGRTGEPVHWNPTVMPRSYGIAQLLISVVRCRCSCNEDRNLLESLAYWLWVRLREFGSWPRDELLMKAADSSTEAKLATLILAYQDGKV